MVVFAIVTERLTTPQAIEDIEAFVEYLRPFFTIQLFPDFREATIVGYAQSNGQDEAPIGEVIERDGLARHFPGSPARKRRYHCSQAYALRASGNGSQYHPGVVGRFVAHIDTIPDKDTIPACPFRVYGQISNYASIIVHIR